LTGCALKFSRSPQDFCRFLLAWQRVDPQHRVEGLEGLQSVLEQLDGCELPLAAWNRRSSPRALTTMTLNGWIGFAFQVVSGWGRLSSPQNPKARAFAPLRTSPSRSTRGKILMTGCI